MKLVLHIGTEKTGTTFLQKWLYENHKSLSAQQIYLSKTIGIPNNRKLVSYFRKAPDDFWNANGIKTPVEHSRFFDGFIDNFEQELRDAENTHDTIIITSEHFHSRLINDEDLQEFAEFCLKNFDSIIILCYLRPQWEVRKSLYSTAIRSGHTRLFSEFDKGFTEQSKYYNYYQLYSRWKSAFPGATINFRLYDRSRFPQGDLRFDMLQTIAPNIELEQFVFSTERANESFKFLKAHALMAVNRAIPMFRPGSIDRRNLSYQLSISQISELDRGDFHDDLAVEIYETFRDSNSRLAREIFGKDELFERPILMDQAEELLPVSEVAKIIRAVVFQLVKKTPNRSLDRVDVDLLRDVALKYQNGQQLNRDEAIRLMEIAQKNRPDGKLINKKLDEWRSG